MRIPFRLVDVFAARPLAGNQLCVVPDPEVVHDLGTQMMQSLAREIGFSETTFVTSVSERRYSMRIFTPGMELPFAGHPTLGTAFVLVTEGRASSPLTQEVKAGEFLVEVDRAGSTARMRQQPPQFEASVEDVADVASAAGLHREDLHPELRPAVVSTGLPHLIVPAANEEAVARARPDEAALGRVLKGAGAEGYYLFALSEVARAKARMFAPDVGVSEDPATGSAAGPLGAYLAREGLLSSGRLAISQGEEIGRPSTLMVEVERDGETWRVWVGGGVYAVAEGAFEVPD